MGVINESTLKNVNATLVTENLKITDGAEVDIWGIVPTIRQALSNRHLAA